MTTAQDSPRPGVSRKKVRWLAAAGLLAAAAIGGGAAFFWMRGSATAPVPPALADDGNDPAVVAAVGVLRARVLKEPHSAAAWGELGTLFLVNTLNEPARPCFARAEQLDPANPRWLYFLGLTYLNQGDRPGALPYLRRAAEAGGGSEAEQASRRLALAETLLSEGQLDEAEAHLRTVLARRPDDPRAHLGLGRVAAAREDWPTARTNFQRCTSNPRARKKACVQLASVCRYLGDREAAEHFRKQGDYLPEDAEWDDPYMKESAVWALSKHSRYAVLWKKETGNRIAEAAQLARKLTEDYPDDFFPFLSLGRDLHEIGDHRGAEAALRKALALAPENVKVHYELGRVLLAKGEAVERAGHPGPARELYQEAAGHARRAVALQPDFGHGHVVLGVALRHLGERAAGIAAIRQAGQCSPESASFHYLLGMALAEEGLDAEARLQFEMALEYGTPTDRWREEAQQRLDALKKKGERKAGG
jgi:tetratricopeptide (TPR) repeat protein